MAIDADAALRLLLYCSLILMSGFFSGSETAMFSLGRVQLMRMKEEGAARAALIEQLLGQPRKLIATIFIGNEFVNIGASALFATVVHRYLHHYGAIAVAVLSTCVSVSLILIFGEITPKNLAARTVERWAQTAARPIAALALLVGPLRWIIERIADAMVYLAGGRSGGQPATVGENEFRTMVDVVRAGGELDQREMELIHNVFEFGDRRVRDVMTPASDVFAISFDLPIARVIELVRDGRYSRIPVYKGRHDNIIGLLYAKDLIALVHKGKSGAVSVRGRPPTSSIRIGLSDLLHDPYFVPRASKCEQLLRVFKRRRIHLAIVVDEYGGFSGLVTMEDLLEEMFGEIRDEKEIQPPEGPSTVSGS